MIRMLSLIVSISVAGVVPWTVEAAEMSAHAVDVQFDRGPSWSGVALPYGPGGTLEWNAGDDLYGGFSVRRDEAGPAREIRTLMFNHQPGAPVTVSFELRAGSLPTNGWCRVRWFDGYVGAIPFYRAADDRFAPFPEAIVEVVGPVSGDDARRIEWTSPPLEHSVLTLAFDVGRGSEPLVGVSGGDATPEDADSPVAIEFRDLRVDAPPPAAIADPGFDWHGRGGGTMTDWRWTTAGAHVDWCDFIDDYADCAVAYWNPTNLITYGMASFRDSGARLLHVKHNVMHHVAEPAVGGASVISLTRNHPGNVPASWGVRQTVGYEAVGLAPAEPGRVLVRIKYSFYESSAMGRAYLQVGCDPRGGIATRDAAWSEPDFSAKWHRRLWDEDEIVFDRPVDSAAFTVFFRCRDGLVQRDGSVVASAYGSRALADWVLVERVDPKHEDAR